jgi:hypothetical protein
MEHMAKVLEVPVPFRKLEAELWSPALAYILKTYYLDNPLRRCLANYAQDFRQSRKERKRESAFKHCVSLAAQYGTNLPMGEV